MSKSRRKSSYILDQMDWDTRLEYCYTAIYYVYGINLPPNVTEANLVDDASTDLNVLLTSNVDDSCFIIDRHTAINNMKLNQFFGTTNYESFESGLAHEMSKIREERRRKIGDAPILVFSASDTMGANPRNLEYESEDYAVYNGAIPKNFIVDDYKDDINAVLASIFLSRNSQVWFEKYNEDVYLTQANGKIIYSHTTYSTVKAHVSSPITTEQLNVISTYLRSHKRNNSWRSLFKFLMLANDRHNSALHTFLFAWAAMEIFVKKHFREYENQFYINLFRNMGNPENIARDYLERHREMAKNNHGLIDKFTFICSVLCPAEANNDLSDFKKINKARNSLFHGDDFQIDSLPSQQLLRLTKKYVRLHVSAKNSS
ncbi:MAG: hypothetical protein R3A44_40920 [Caldilineaceae bacterium]